jgi:hypothetical protein
VITEPLLSNGLPLWLYYSGLQAMLTKSLSSNVHIRHNAKFNNFALVISLSISRQWELLSLNPRHSREKVVANHIITPMV